MSEMNSDTGPRRCEEHHVNRKFYSERIVSANMISRKQMEGPMATCCLLETADCLVTKYCIQFYSTIKTSLILQRPLAILHFDKSYVKLLDKESNKMHLFVCVYSKICILHVSNGYTVQHQQFTYHCICTAQILE